MQRYLLAFHLTGLKAQSPHVAGLFSYIFPSKVVEKTSYHITTHSDG
jgi:hypothetical protein